jgi:xanthine dehydrogenase accessory factor
MIPSLAGPRPIDIHRKIVELVDGGVRLAVALVLATEGSTPQRAGARAVLDESGHLWGTVGGSAVEAHALRMAAEACRSQCPAVFDFHLSNLDAAQSGAICGGTMRILVDPTVAAHRSCFARAAEALDERRRGVLLTTIRPGPPPEVQVAWLAEDAISGAEAFPGGDAIRSCLDGDRPQRFVAPAEAAAGSQEREVFVEPVTPRPLLVIAGAGHVGQAVAALAAQVGFDVTVIDDRPELAAPALFPQGTRLLCGPIPAEIAECPLDRDTYVVLVTRGHRHDADALAACIRRQPGYLGMIGSRRKVALIRQSFLETGLATEAEFDRVFAPVGLKIGAVTVPEIAVSIVAQLIAVRRKADLR